MFKRIFLITSVIFLLILSDEIVAQNAKSIVYVGGQGDLVDVRIIDNDDDYGAMIITGDIAFDTDVFFDSNLFSIDSRFVEFSVPCGDLTVGDTWNFKDRDYKVVEKKELSIWSTERDVFVIESSVPHLPHKLIYLYSSEYGLLSFQTYFADSAYSLESSKVEDAMVKYTYWLSGTYGLGIKSFE